MTRVERGILETELGAQISVLLFFSSSPRSGPWPVRAPGRDGSWKTELGAQISVLLFSSSPRSGPWPVRGPERGILETQLGVGAEVI